jgi:hypothetical protein
MPVLRLRWLWIVAPLLFADAAFGDGCYIPLRAFPKIPEISAQRAALFWRNGQETLVISSALDSESQKLGWIIPLPSVPTTIEKETPGALKTLDLCIQPKITHDLYRDLKGTVVAALVGNLGLGIYLFKRKFFVKFLILVLILAVLSALTLSASMGTGVSAIGVQLEKTVAVGAYDVTVLRAKELENLNNWLSENGFAALPPTAGDVVADYIADNWVFAAIKLTRATAGANTPHPIRMMFPAKEAVYPLKLTALAGKSTSFEIFVVGDDRAVCKPLDATFCDRFSSLKKKGFTGTATAQTIGHPAVCSLMWDGCVLTKFAGTISAANMTADIRFDWMPFDAYQQHFYTRHGAWQFTLLVFVSLAGGWGVLSMLACANKIEQSPRRGWYFVRVLLPGVILAAVVAGIELVRLPRIADCEVEVGPAWRQSTFVSCLRNDIEDALKDRPAIIEGTQDEIAARLLETLAMMGPELKMRNVITGTPVVVEDSPGNFTVEKQSNKVVVRVYDTIGLPIVVEQTLGKSR